LRQIPGVSKWLVVAVQALHPFYDRKANEVVASWMTRLDRELAIEDNLRYVGEVVSAVQREFQPAERLVYAGFSQGVAMAYRAAAGAGHACQGVIALAGDFPPELKERSLSSFPPVLLGRGSEERWYDEKKLARDLEHFRSRGFAVETCLFAGGHEWTAEFYEAAGRFLARSA
jgi:predicted esterase